MADWVSQQCAKISQSSWLIIWFSSSFIPSGITAFILCLLAMSSGLAALCSARVKRVITPLLNKTFHNFLGFACFVIALVTQYYGYQTGYFKNRTETDFQILMKVLTLLSLVLTSYGPLKAFYHKVKAISRQC